MVNLELLPPQDKIKHLLGLKNGYLYDFFVTKIIKTLTKCHRQNSKE